MLHLPDELLLRALLGDDQRAVTALGLQALGGEGAAVDHLLGVLGDVDEAARTGKAGAELGDVQVAVGGRFRQAQEGHIQAAALIEVELHVVGDDGHGVGGRAELGAAHGNTGNGTGLHRQGHLVADALLGGHVGDLLRRAGAQIDDGVLGQLHGGTAGDDLLGVQRDSGDDVHGDTVLAGKAAVIGSAQALHIVLGGADNNGVHIDAGDGHQLGVQGAALHHLFHLHDDLAAGVAAGLGHGGDVDGPDLVVDGAVAILVGVAAPDEHHIDGEGLIQQPLLTLNIDDLHDILGGGAVQLAAAVAGIHKGIQAHMGDGADLVGGDVPVHMGDDALGQVVGLDLVLQRQRAQGGGAVPVSADDALDHTLVAVVVAAGAVPVALTGREEQRQVTGVAGLQEPLFHRFAERLRAGRADKAAGGDGVAVVDQQGGLLSGDDAYFLHR